MDFPFNTTIFFYAVVDGARFPGQTVIGGATKDEYNENLGEFFNTLAAKVDEDGNAAFVVFEPRELTGARAAVAAGPGGPLPDAPKQFPNCPIHRVPLKEKNGRNGPFVSCSQRTPTGYCNWKPNDK